MHGRILFANLRNAANLYKSLFPLARSLSNSAVRPRKLKNFSSDNKNSKESGSWRSSQKSRYIILSTPDSKDEKTEKRKFNSTAGAILGAAMTGVMTFAVNTMLNKANRNEVNLHGGIYDECKAAILKDNQILHDTHVSDCQTRLLFYNEKRFEDITKHKEYEVLLNIQLVKNKLIQDRLTDLINAARAWGGEQVGYEKATINRASVLLRQQQRQRFYLLLAHEMNGATLVYKQGQYNEALVKIQKIESLKAQEYSPPENERLYLPDQTTVLKLENEYSFIRDFFTNVYNVKGMIVRSLSQKKDPKYTLEQAKACFEIALTYNRHPAVLSNLGFIYNKMASEKVPSLRNAIGEQKIKIESEIADLKGRALHLHKEATLKKLSDENDAAIFNGIAYSLQTIGDPNQYKIALGFFDRALNLKPSERNILENKANLLVKMADEAFKGNKEFPFPQEKYLEQAEDCLNEVMRTNIELADTLMLRAQISLRLAKYQEALDYLEMRKANKTAYADQLNWYDDEEFIHRLRSQIEAEKSKKTDKSKNEKSKKLIYPLDLAVNSALLCARFSEIYKIPVQPLNSKQITNSKDLPNSITCHQTQRP